MGILDGKVAIITGAGGGLGETHALLMAQEGAKIVVNDLGGAMDGSGEGAAMADQVVAKIKEAGGEAIANYASVSDPDGAQSMVDDAVNTWGRLDILVNNAGILRDKTLLKLEPNNFDLVMEVHARGTYLCTRAAAAKMKELGNGGSIVNTSSIAGLKGNFGQTNYACAKAGIAGMTRVWSQELVRAGIRTNAIAPMAKTRMTEDISAVPDIGPEEISPMVLFLASDLAKDVNGRIFGCHGPHLFEYHMMLSPGVELKDEQWTASKIKDQLDAISALPSQDAPTEGDGGGATIEAQVGEVFSRMPDLFMPERAGDWVSVIHFDISGTGSWAVRVADGKCTTDKGKPEDARCNITYKSADILLGSVTGKINPQQAFMSGQITADNMGDLMKFAQCFDMKKAAALAKEKSKGGAKATVEDQCGQVFERMPNLFMPERAGSWASVLHFNITGTGSWTVRVADGNCTTEKGKPDDALCNITYQSADILLGAVTGKINPQQAFMQGQISADNMGDLMKFAQCFDMKKASEIAKKEAGNATVSTPANGGMNREALGATFRMSAEFVYPEQTQAYAKSTNDTNKAYLNGGDIVAPVLFPVRPFMKALGDAVVDKDLNADLLRLVHGEQDMHFYDVLKPWDLVAARATLLDIEDKSSGQLLKVRQRLMRDGEIVCETISGFFVRAKKRDGEKKTAKPEETQQAPPSYLFESTFPVDDDQSYRYADASLDKNPIHVDDNTAKAAGHPGVILHGLCTMAMTTREVVNKACNGDPKRLKRIKVRFTKVVLPGDTLTTRAWLVDDSNGVTTIGLETINQNGDLVIGNALAEIAN